MLRSCSKVSKINKQEIIITVDIQQVYLITFSTLEELKSYYVFDDPRFFQDFYINRQKGAHSTKMMNKSHYLTDRARL